MRKKRLRAFSLVMVFAMILQLFAGIVPPTTNAVEATVSPVVNGNSVTFNYVSKGETAVYLVGSVTSWDETQAIEMKLENGVFTATVENLKAGLYEYKFLLNEKKWGNDIVDPLNSQKSGGNSAFRIGEAPAGPVIAEDGTVTFEYKGDATRVRVAGSFTSWADGALDLTKNSDGVWQLKKQLAPGTYEYKLILDKDGWMPDPSNPNQAENGNSVIHVSGLIVNASAENVKKGQSVTLSAKELNTKGESTTVEPEWTLKDARTGISLDGNKVSIADTYKATENDSVTVVGTYNGKKAEKKINILGTVYTFKINYYRYDGKQNDWDMWIWEDNKEGKEYDFTSTVDGFAQTTVQVPTNKLNVITRPGNWTTQEATRTIQIPSGDTTEVWIVQGQTDVKFTKPDVDASVLAALMDTKNSITVSVNKQLEDATSFKLVDVAAKKEIATTTTKVSDTKVKLTVTNPEEIDVTKIYSVEATGYKAANVTMRNILNDDAYYYEGDDLGYTYTPAKTSFKLWAPTATKVSVATYDGQGTYDGAFVTDNTGGTETAMTRSANGVWSLELSGDLKNKYYMYKIEFANGKTNYAVDPYARSTSPNGQRTVIVDLDSTDPAGFNPDAKPALVSPTDAILYELHVRDFSIDENSGVTAANKGKYKAFTETGTTTKAGTKTGLDSLKELGVTHVHLLPVYDFGSVNELTVNDPNSKDPKFNWGYDPIHFNVPEGSYSSNPADPTARITEFKQMVQAMHNNGMRVVMDVVYNHTYMPEATQLKGGSPFDLIVPGYYYRTNDNGQITNGSGTGNEVASERPMIRKYIKDSVKYWATEYGVDGFRFDLMGLIDKQTMTELTKELKEEVNPSILVYGEPWTGGSTSLDASLQNFKGTQKDKGYAVFNDNIRGAIKGGSDDGTTGFATGSTGKEADIARGVKGSIEDFTNRPSESINYVTAHDNLNLWDKLMKVAGTELTPESNPHASITETNVLDNEWVKRSLLANGVVLTSQGIPFIHAGEEMLRSKYGNHNSYKSPDSINQIRWELKDQYKPVFDYYQGLIELRKAHPAFKMNTKAAIEQNLQVFKTDDNIVAFQLKNYANNDTWKNIVVIYNANKTAKEVNLPATADWNVVVDDKAAGTKTLRVVKGAKATVAPLSMMVLYDQAEGEYTPVVTNVETSVTDIALNANDSKTVTAYVKDQKGRMMLNEKITWSSSNEEVATVVGGKIFAVKNGEATITAAAGDKKATINVKVATLVPNTVLITGDKSVFETYTIQLSAAVSDQFNQEMLGAKVTWSSSDETIATVDGTGKVTGLKPGVATIKAKAGEAEALLAVTVKKNVKRYVRVTYVRPDKDFSDWNIWTWNTGVKNDQIDFVSFDGDKAVANIEIAPSTENIGFLIRKGTDWNTAKQGPESDDHNVKIDKDDVLTKVTVVTGVQGQTVAPSVKGPVLEDGNVTFYYRDDVLFEQDKMNTIDSVKVKVDGIEREMKYEAAKEYFVYTLENLDPGKHEYSFLVTKNGETTEVTDPRNTVNGKSIIEYIVPKVTITGSVTPGKITPSENTVLSVDVQAEAGVTFKELYVDATPIGGKAKQPIDQVVKAVTIGAADTVAAGMKELTIVAVDSYGNKHRGTVKVEVLPRTYQGDLDFDWDEARIYFMLTDRFKDGDASNNPKLGYDPNHSEAYHGGDFKGIIDNLDYLDKLGINTIWISPIVDNIDFNKGVDFKTAGDLASKQYAYHGYWAKDFTSLDPTLGDMETFKQLIEKAHDRGIKIMVDVVLNHTGYGMRQVWDTWAKEEGLPTQAERDALKDMIRMTQEDPTVRGDLDNLPDLKTEDPAVRAKIVEWQTAWLEKARTAEGETIDYFRVDTVKHVEDATWMAFKNALTKIDPDFKMIGEFWGASVNNDGGYLRSGQMDSLLDFDFKEKAKAFVEGDIAGVQAYLTERNAKIDNTSTLGQFLSSHDQNGFLSEYVGGDYGKLMVAAALQVTAKGQPVIYYGEELGRSGKSDWIKDSDGNVVAFGGNRGAMPWDKLEKKDPTALKLHEHYTKLLNIRADYSKVFSKGTHTMVAGGNTEGYSVTQREFLGTSVYVGLNTKTEKQTVTFNVAWPVGTVLVDQYSGVSYTVAEGGKVTVELPSRDNGGTFVLVKATSTGEPGNGGGTNPGNGGGTNPGNGGGTNPGDGNGGGTNPGNGGGTNPGDGNGGGTNPGNGGGTNPGNGNNGGDNVVVKPVIINGVATIPNSAIEKVVQNGSITVEWKSATGLLSLTPEQVQTLKEKGAKVVLTNNNVTIKVPTAVLPNGAAKIEMVSMKKVKGAVSAVYDFNIYDAKGNKITKFSQSITIVFNVGLQKNGKDLEVYYFNEKTKKWELVAGAVYQNGKVSVPTNHFSTFAVFNSNTPVLESTPAPTPGKALPNTATNTFNILLLGLVLLFIGASALVTRKRRA